MATHRTFADEAEWLQLQGLLRFNRSGRFYKLSHWFTPKQLKQFFQDVADPAPLNSHARSLTGYSGLPIQLIRRAPDGQWSASGKVLEGYASLWLEPVLRSPTLAPRSVLRELTYAHLMIFEVAVLDSRGRAGQKFAFVQRDLVDDPLELDTSGSWQPLGYAEMLNPFLPASSPSGADIPRIQELSMRMLNTSRAGLRRKVVEAFDVETATSSLGLHRAIAGSMRVRVPDSYGLRSRDLAISPHRNALRTGSSRVTLEELTMWVGNCIAAFDRSSGVTNVASPFLSQMAHPVLALTGQSPTSFLLDASELREAIDADGWSWQPPAANLASWPSLDAVIDAFADTIEIAPSATTPVGATGPGVATVVVEFSALLPSAHATTAISISVQVNSASCAMKVSPRGALGKFNKPGAPPLGFEDLVTRRRAMRIPFDSGRILYCVEGAFRSGNFVLAVDQLTRIFRPCPALAGVYTEKGAVAPSDTSFQTTTAFHFIETSTDITNPASALLCCDARDEICDYLELDAQKPRIQWLHAKVAGRQINGVPAPVSSSGTISASKLQEVVGQATKNLAFLRMLPSDPRFSRETATWTQMCALPDPGRISRTRRTIAGGTNAASRFERIVGDPLAVHEVAIVVPNYSLARLAHELQQIPAGTARQPAIQMFWLLSGFMHACLEVGATPYVYMQP